MREGREREAVRVVSPAKINWFLDVGSRRADGYHEVQTVMQMVSVADVIECRATDDGAITLTTDGMPCGGSPDDNLVVRAARAARAHLRMKKGARIKLTKRIPVAAGLGGGSSNAAAVLRAVQRVWCVHIAPEDLRVIARALGADVAFFLGTPAAACTGIGELLSPLTPRCHWLVLWNPGMPLSTKAVYAAFDERPRLHRDMAAFLGAYSGHGAGRMADAVWNNLGLAAEECLPRLRTMQEEARACGARAAWISGSGPTVAALCDDEPHASRLAAALRGRASGQDVLLVCHTLTELPE